MSHVKTQSVFSRSRPDPPSPPRLACRQRVSSSKPTLSRRILAIISRCLPRDWYKRETRPSRIRARRRPVVRESVDTALLGRKRLVRTNMISVRQRTIAAAIMFAVVYHLPRIPRICAIFHGIQATRTPIARGLRAELMYPSFNTVFVREAIRIRMELRPKS